jgi:hypothetical protein
MAGFFDVLASGNGHKKEKVSKSKNKTLGNSESSVGDGLYQKIIKDDEYLCLIGFLSKAYIYENRSPNPIWPGVVEGLKKELDDNPNIEKLVREVFSFDLIDDIQKFEESLLSSTSYDARYYQGFCDIRENQKQVYLSARNEFKANRKSFRFLPKKVMRRLK